MYTEPTYDTLRFISTDKHSNVHTTRWVQTMSSSCMSFVHCHNTFIFVHWITFQTVKGDKKFKCPLHYYNNTSGYLRIWTGKTSQLYYTITPHLPRGHHALWKLAWIIIANHLWSQIITVHGRKPWYAHTRSTCPTSRIATSHWVLLHSAYLGAFTTDQTNGRTDRAMTENEWVKVFSFVSGCYRHLISRIKSCHS
jgi:hypothetical protein